MPSDGEQPQMAPKPAAYAPGRFRTPLPEGSVPVKSGRSDRLGAYRQAEGTKTGAEREQEILRHLPLVQTVVDRVCAHLPPTVDKEDLFHAGVIGLIDALARFDASRDNAFSTYAVMRIRGQIIDELRARDWVPRSARERARDYHRAVGDLSATLGRLPADAEVAKALGVDENELPEVERQAQLAAQVSIDAPAGEDGVISSLIADRDTESANPARYMEREDLKRLLANALRTLTEQERLVVKLYYFENLLLKEIAAILGVTESRVCQINGRVMGLLRTRLTAHGAV
jgi:RNA polymerase sigma factor for flagellar operon FliA